MAIDVPAYNKAAWNREVTRKNRWTVPVAAEEVARARQGDWQIVLTPTKAVPTEWLGKVKGRKVLGLAAGGGQQGPLLAAAGAEVTIFDNSPKQLAQDQAVAKREGLSIQTVEGDMRDLSVFADESFDLVIHPCSNCFVDRILPVWREAHRVLKKGGALLSGFCQPIIFLGDPALAKQGIVQLKYQAPYSDVDHAGDPEIQKILEAGEPLCFGHTLEDQIGGQTQAGFAITGFYEDGWAESDEAIQKHLPCFGATRAVKV